MDGLNNDIIDGLPNLCGAEHLVEQAMAKTSEAPAFLHDSGIDFASVQAAFSAGLHMHQPLIPAGGQALQTAALISNLQHMLDSGSDEHRHNADIFRWCYRRMGEFIPQLVADGKRPRIMLDYSGTLLWGFRLHGMNDVIENLRAITCDPRYRGSVEWLGTAWGHAVAPSTPVQDFRLHVRAFQHHFASIFGLEALARVRGFSPPEMALPNHPDVAYEFVKTLRDCGFRWVLVQEHSVEQPETGMGARELHLPHRLVCRNSRGDVASIVAVIKTQGSDTKLVAQMQPYYEAKGLSRATLAGRSVPRLVTQIADGENGGVMMHEFPAKYQEVMRECAGSSAPVMNAGEYLEHLFATGVREEDLPVIQPVWQHRIWARFKPGRKAKLAPVLQALRDEDGRFHVDGGSWTNDISWVKGYGDLLGPMEALSSLFYEKTHKPPVRTAEHRYRNALLHLLASQTSCYRYWGQGQWPDYGREICRRGTAILEHDF